MENVTSSELHTERVVTWVLVPVLFSLLLYLTLSMFVWPYARPVVPLWVLLLVLFFPPFLPLLVVYVLLLVAERRPPLPPPPPVHARIYVVDGPSTTTATRV